MILKKIFDLDAMSLRIKIVSQTAKSGLSQHTGICMLVLTPSSGITMILDVCIYMMTSLYEWAEPHPQQSATNMSSGAAGIHRRQHTSDITYAAQVSPNKPY